MLELANFPAAPETAGDLANARTELSGLEERRPPLLSLIAGMVNLTGFLTLAASSPPTSPAIWCWS